MFDISRETAKAWKNIQTFVPSALLYVVVLIIVIVVGVRITSDDITAARLDQTTLLYIAFAGVLILVVTGRVKTFEIPNVVKMELETIKKELEASQAQAREAKAEANAAHDALRYGTINSVNSK